MKSILLLSAITLLILTSTFAWSLDNYAGSMSIRLQFKGFGEKDSTKLSAFQFPDFKEDDYIRLWKVIVFNNGNSTSPEHILKIVLRSPERNFSNLFCLDSIEVPKLPSNKAYVLQYIGESVYYFDDEKYRLTSCEDSLGNKFQTCAIKLSSVGFWDIDVYYEPKNSSESVGYSVGLIDNKKGIYNLNFKVRKKSEMLLLSQQKVVIAISIVAILVTSLIGYASIKSQKKFAKWQRLRQKRDDRNYQRDILKNIATLVEVINDDRKGHLEELKKSVIPSYYITPLSSSFFITQLKSQYVRIPTSNLKKLLIRAQHKIENINRMTELMQETEILGNENKKEELFQEIRASKYKYHSHLNELLILIQEELKQFGLFN